MIRTLARLFARSEPILTEAGPSDAAAMATLHARSFHRGWGESEFDGLLADPTIVAHRAMSGRSLLGFIVSRCAAGEAEILSVAVEPAHRARGLARALLGLHLRRLAALGTGSVFLEVGEDNAPARRLYERFGFRRVGRREAYYRDPGGGSSAALVLRRDLR